MTTESFLDRVGRVTNGFMEAKIVLAGVELKLFDRLAEGPTTAPTLAADLEVTERGITILADALAAFGYLDKQGDTYANTPDVDQHLVRGRPGSVAYITGHRNQMFRRWAVLEDTIRHGQPRDERAKPTLTDPEANRNFILGMAEVSRERLEPILDKLPLSDVALFVDVGGGPAQYACEAARRHPGLKAIVLDLPLTVEVATAQIAAQGLTDRVRAEVCDFYHEPRLTLDAPADVMLISQVLHAEGPDENRALLRKAFDGVRPGGVLAIVENLVDASRAAPPPGAMFAVNMLAGTARGRTYTADEIEGWLSEAGFAPRSTEAIAPRTWLTLAQRPA